jgi:hypothetical protein
VNPNETYVLTWAPWNGRVALELNRSQAAHGPAEPEWRADAMPWKVYTRDSGSGRWTRYTLPAPRQLYSLEIDGSRVPLDLGLPMKGPAEWERAVREGVTVANLGISASVAGASRRGYRRNRRNT